MKTIAAFLIALAAVLHANAQAPAIRWWYNTHDASFGQSAAGDIDGDGLPEIVFGCYRNDSCVYALNAENGTLLWKYNTHPPGAEGCNDVAPVIYDVDGDSFPEVIVPSSCNPVTFCFDGLTGSVKWQCDTRGSDSPPVVADVDNDSKPEILHGEFGGYVKCIDAENGHAAWELPVDLNSWIQTAPTTVDLDTDGQLDFVVGTWNFNGQDSLYAFRGDNRARLWAYPVHDFMYHGTAVADLDHDGKPELVIGSYNDTLYCINGENGTSCWKFRATGGYIGSPATIADLDNDGNCEVVFVSAYKVYVLTNTGGLKWQYVIPGYEQSFRGAAIADINNDQFPDVIFGTDGGKVMALNGNNGSRIWSVDLAAHYGNTAFAIDHAPLVADFDQDDSLEVFIVGGHAEYPAFQNNFGRAYMITAGKGNGPDWMMFQRDIRRQSSMCTFPATGIAEAQESARISVFPVPFSDQATVESNQPLTDGTLTVYDIFGQAVRRTGHLSGQTFTIERGGLPSGIYLLCLQQDGSTIAVKKILLTD